MLQWIKRIWHGLGPVEFESAFGLDESVDRLKAATRRVALFSSEEVAAGRVSESRVSLQRVIPMVGNSFKPFFVGRFERHDDKVILVGRFTMSWFVKSFMVFWLGICALITAVSALSAIPSPKTASISLVGAVMLVSGFALIRFGEWLSRNDPAWLSRVIQKTLEARIISAPSNLPSIQLEQTPTSGTPWAIAKVVLLLGVLGVLGCVSTFTGIQTYRGGPTGSVITHYSDDRLRYAAGMMALAMLALSYGIYRRRLVAWRLLFWLGGVAYAVQFYGLFINNYPSIPYPVLVLFAVLSALIMVVWGRWWYAQRKHFQG